MKLPEDHIWPLAGCFVIAVLAYTIMALGGEAQAGTLLRSAIIGLSGAVAGYAAGKS